MIMERVIKDTLEEIENDLIEPIIRQASHEMTQSKVGIKQLTAIQNTGLRFNIKISVSV